MDIAGRRAARLVVLLSAIVGLVACGGSDGEPVEVELVELVEDQEGYDGQMVVAEGVVRTYDEPRHYWIEDADLNRVELSPDEVVSPHLGERVRVVGRYTFRDDEGRRIAVDELEVVDDGGEVRSLARVGDGRR